MARKPKGYWTDFANVKRELLAFVASEGVPGSMPTATELRRAGHGSLAIAIHKHCGDFQEAARLLSLSATRKPRGYWKDFENVKRELLAFIAEEGGTGRMPTMTELRAAGRGSLVSAIHEHHGDFQEVAQRLHLSTPYRPKGYWKDFRNVKCELLAFIAEQGVDGMMPTESELRDAGRSSLTFAICQYHGDFHEVARRLHLSTRRKRRNACHRVNDSKRNLTT